MCGGTLATAATTGLLYQIRMIGDGDCGEIGGMKIGRQGKPKYSEKTCPSDTLSTTNPACSIVPQPTTVPRGPQINCE
jgi:hypothetical protein